MLLPQHVSLSLTWHIRRKIFCGCFRWWQFLYVARKATLHAPYADVQSFWLGKDYTFRHLNFNMCATKFQDSLQVFWLSEISGWSQCVDRHDGYLLSGWNARDVSKPLSSISGWNATSASVALRYRMRLRFPSVRTFQVVVLNHCKVILIRQHDRNALYVFVQEAVLNLIRCGFSTCVRRI